MAELQDRQKWAEEQKARARELLESAQRIAGELFAAGDLLPYLDVLSRLNHFNCYNLLLICRQYPSARCLAFFKQWASMLPPGAAVLRPEWRSKGLDLLVPFTDLSSGSASLIWFAVKQFDLSQTTITDADYTPPASVYTYGAQHREYLLRALRRVLSEEEGISVVYDDPAGASDRRRAGIPGRLEGKRLWVNRALSADNQLRWLIECLTAVRVSEEPALSAYKVLLSDCISYALFSTWGLPGREEIRMSKMQLRSVPESLQLPFLSAVQRIERSMEESISIYYGELLRQPGEEGDIIF